MYNVKAAERRCDAHRAEGDEEEEILECRVTVLLLS